MKCIYMYNKTRLRRALKDLQRLMRRKKNFVVKILILFINHII